MVANLNADILHPVKDIKNEIFKEWCKICGVNEPIEYYVNITFNKIVIHTMEPGKMLDKTGENIDLLKRMLFDMLGHNYEIEVYALTSGRITNIHNEKEIRNLDWVELNDIHFKSENKIFNNLIITFEIIQISNIVLVLENNDIDNNGPYRVSSIEEGKELSQRLFNKYCTEILYNISE